MEKRKSINFVSSLLAFLGTATGNLHVQLTGICVDWLKNYLEEKDAFRVPLSEKLSKDFDEAFSSALKSARAQLTKDSYKKILDELSLNLSSYLQLDTVLAATDSYIESCSTPKDLDKIVTTVLACFWNQLEYYPELLNYLNMDTMKSQINQLSSDVEDLKKKAFRPAQLVLPSFPPAMQNLIGRDNTLQQFDEKFRSHSKIAVVTGIGGIGKTEFVKKYISSNRSAYSAIGWLEYKGTFRDTLLDGNLVKNSKCEPSDQELRYAEILRLLLELDENAVLVFDNVNEICKEDIAPILQLRCQVIFTTRSPMQSYENSMCLYPLDVLSPEDCVDLFEHYLGKTVTAEREALSKVIVRAGRHTLALELLAKTCRAARLSISELLEHLEKSGFSLEGISERVCRENESEYQRFIEHMSKLYDLANISQAGEDAEHILKNLCILPLENLDIKVLRNWLALSSYDTLNRLHDAGWIKITDDKVTMHGVIGEVLRYKLKPQLEDCGQLVNSLSKAIDYEQTDINLYSAPYFGYAAFAAQRLEGETTGIADLYFNLAFLYNARGSYTEAQNYYEKALAIITRVLGAEHPSTATTYNNIAMVCQAQGEYDKALEFYGKALAIGTRLLGPEHPDTAATYNNVAAVYHDQGEYDKALEFYEKALAIRTRALGAEHPDTATTYNNVAAVYHDQGEYDKALECFLKALSIRTRVLGAEHPFTATTYNNIAGVYQAQGEYDKALEFYEKALAIRTRVLGAEHSSTATTYNNIAGVYYAQGEYDKALEYYEKALAIKIRVLGIEHPSTATTYNNIAGVYKTQREYTKALEYYKKALTVTRVLGAEHPSTATTYNDIAGVYQAQGEYDKALEYYEKALAIRTRVLGAEHPDTATTYNNIAGVYKAQGEYDKALRFYEKAHAITTYVLGNEHPSTAIIYFNLGFLLFSMNDDKKALQYCQRAYDTCKEKLGERHPTTLQIQEGLDIIQNHMGNQDT